HTLLHTPYRHPYHLDPHSFPTRRSSDLGLENVQVIPTKGHPLVYADWLHASGKPTVLCYAHYDVQPPDPLDEWISPPFEPTERKIEEHTSELQSRVDLVCRLLLEKKKSN